MKVQFEIPTAIEFIDVELEGYPHSLDDSFSHEFGIMSYEPRIVLDEDPTWDYKKYTQHQNNEIASYISKKYEDIETTFVNQFKKSICD